MLLALSWWFNEELNYGERCAISNNQGPSTYVEHPFLFGSPVSISLPHALSASPELPHLAAR